MSVDEGYKSWCQEQKAINGFTEDDKFYAYIRYSAKHPDLTDEQLGDVCNKFINTDYFESEPGVLECFDSSFTSSETSDTELIPEDTWTLYCNETWGEDIGSEKNLG